MGSSNDHPISIIPDDVIFVNIWIIYEVSISLSPLVTNYPFSDPNTLYCNCSLENHPRLRQTQQLWICSWFPRWCGKSPSNTPMASKTLPNPKHLPIQSNQLHTRLLLFSLCEDKFIRERSFLLSVTKEKCIKEGWGHQELCCTEEYQQLKWWRYRNLTMWTEFVYHL